MVGFFWNFWFSARSASNTRRPDRGCASGARPVRDALAERHP